MGGIGAGDLAQLGYTAAVESSGSDWLAYEQEGAGDFRYAVYVAWLANLWARTGNGEQAEKALEVFTRAFTLRNSFHCNGDQSGKGYSRFTYRPFTVEGNFAAAAGLQEMLLHSHRGTIQVFPAVPNSWQDVTFATLRAQGAFLVSAQRLHGEVTRLEIFSEKGGTCRFLSPFRGEIVLLDTSPG